MPESNNDNNLFPNHPDGEDNIFPTHPQAEDSLFPTQRDTKDNLFAVGEFTQEELEAIERYADEKELDPVNRARLIAQYRDAVTTQKKPNENNEDSLW